MKTIICVLRSLKGGILSAILSNMTTITVPKSKFEILKKRASLYETILRTLPERKWGIEEYPEKRIKELMQEDRLNKKVRARIQKLLSS